VALPTKQVGVAGEHFFAFRALEEGLDVAFPTGDNSPHDLIISSASGYFRVQIKTSNVLVKDATRSDAERYTFTISHSRGPKKQPYDDDDFDVLALIVLPERRTYLIPADVGTSVTCIGLTRKADGARTSRYEEYLERWNLFSKNGDNRTLA
jgi:hypothetical protein